MRRHLRAGRLRGVAVSATNYHTGSGVTFFEGAADIQPWTRSTRIGMRARITLEHVMASAAIPVSFRRSRIDGTFYGDGCVRMNYPMSPAIHLGAERIVAVSVRHLDRPARRRARGAREGDELPLSEIAGVLLNAVFLDSLDSDLERLDRINRTLALIPRERSRARTARSGRSRRSCSARRRTSASSRPTSTRFPRMLRYLLKGIGAAGHAGEDLLSYLAFEPVYVQRVMDLGYADTLARRDEIADFFFGPPRQRARAQAARRYGARLLEPRREHRRDGPPGGGERARRRRPPSAHGPSARRRRGRSRSGSAPARAG